MERSPVQDKTQGDAASEKDAPEPSISSYDVLTDFERVVKEARNRFDKFLSLHEQRIFDEFADLPEEARRTYARLFRRKFPQWVDRDDSGLEEPWIQKPRIPIMTKTCSLGRKICGSALTYGGCLLQSLTAKARKELPFGGDLHVAERQRTLDKKCGADLLFSVMCSLPKVILDPDIRSVFVLAHRLVFPFADDPTHAAWLTFHRQEFPAASRCSARGSLVQPFHDRAHVDAFCAARDLQCEYALWSDHAHKVDICEQFAEAAECAFLCAPRCESRYSAHYVSGELLWHALQNCADGKSKVRRLVLLLDKSSVFLRSVGMRHFRWLNTLSIAVKAEPALQAYVCAVALSCSSAMATRAGGENTCAQWNPEVEELSKRARRLGVEGIEDLPVDDEITVKEIFKPRCKKRTRGGARAEYIGYGTQSVESVVLARYVPSEFDNGVHCEGRMLSQVFYILCEDLLVEYGQFSSAYEMAPRALLDGSFRQHPKVREFLASLALWSFEDLARAVEKAVVFIPDGGPVPPAAEELESLDLASLDAESLAQHNVNRTDNGWNFKPPVMQCCPCIGGAVLSKILDRMMMDWRYMTGGLPDLLLWNTKRRQAAFVEVKSENDRLSTKQSHWLRYLQRSGAQAWVCHVRDAKVIDL